MVTFLGIKLCGNIHLWDPENSLLQNLKNILEIDFPVHGILEKSDFSTDWRFVMPINLIVSFLIMCVIIPSVDSLSIKYAY